MKNTNEFKETMKDPQELLEIYNKIVVQRGPNDPEALMYADLMRKDMEDEAPGTFNDVLEIVGEPIDVILKEVAEMPKRTFDISRHTLTEMLNTPLEARDAIKRILTANPKDILPITGRELFKLLSNLKDIPSNFLKVYPDFRKIFREIHKAYKEGQRQIKQS